jgi:hypothetical protein
VREICSDRSRIKGRSVVEAGGAQEGINIVGVDMVTERTEVYREVDQFNRRTGS